MFFVWRARQAVGGAKLVLTGRPLARADGKYQYLHAAGTCAVDYTRFIYVCGVRHVGHDLWQHFMRFERLSG